MIQIISWNVEVNLVNQLVQAALVRYWVRILAILSSFSWFSSVPADEVHDSTSYQTRSAFCHISFSVILLFDCRVGMLTALLSKPQNKLRVDQTGYFETYEEDTQNYN
jgi:hypothetical protein